MSSRPVLRPGHQTLLTAVGQDVLHPRDLGFLLVRDQDHVIAIPPYLLGPARQAGDLPRQIRAEVAHEEGELEGVGRGEEEVKVRRHEGVGVDLQRVEALGSAQDSQDDLIEERTGNEEAAPLKGTLGDFDEASGFGNVTWHSHATE